MMGAVAGQNCSIFSANDSPNSLFSSTTNSAMKSSFNPSLSYSSQLSFSSNARLVNSTNQNLFSSLSTLYGVGLSYQLYEMQQIYRHPRKVYEIAYNFSINQSPNSSQASTQPPSSTKPAKSDAPAASAASISLAGSNQPFKNLFSINEFYKNCILPILVPVHYCCTPLLFYSNWSELVITETMLKSNYTNKLSMGSSNKSEAFSSGALLNKQAAGKAQTGISSMITAEPWYYKMRQIVLTEYSKYFEAKGFIRLRDEKSESQLKQQQQQQQPPQMNPQQQQQQQQRQQQASVSMTEAQTHHFIKWVQQDGFLYLTINIEEIFVHVKIGYCTRYRSASRSFVNEIVKFLTQDFHVHSFIYDFHLSAINRNFSSSITGSQISQTSFIIVKFLDEFVEFFSRIPSYSCNKVFKKVYEKSDSSLIPHQFRLIFDFIIDSKTKLNNGQQDTNLLFQTLYVFDNNIGIYSLTDASSSKSASSDYIKYLVIKIESYYNASNVKGTNSSAKKTTPSIKGNDSVNLTPTNSTKGVQSAQSKTTSVVNLSKLSNSSSSSSLLSPNSIHSENLLSSITTNNMTDSSITQSSQAQQMPLIRIISYYFCINKNQQVQQQSVENSSSLASIALMKKFNEDLSYIEKVIEQSLSLYKQEIFWDNLTSSITSLNNFLNENNNTSLINYPIVFTVNSDELEQILSISQKIDILELDTSLGSFLEQCYSIKEKIRTYLKFSFGRHFIYTSSDTNEYCLLLINDELIRNFKHTPTSSTTSSESGSAQLKSSNETAELKSFILLKFDKVAKTTQILQVNRVKSSAKDASQAQDSVKPPQQISFAKRSSTTDNLQTSPNVELASSLRSDTTSCANFNSLTGVKTHKHLSFTINTLMYVLWESLFYPN